MFLARALAQEPARPAARRADDAPRPASSDASSTTSRAQRCRQDGLGVLSVLHDLNLAAAYCDRLVLLAAGRVVCAGRPADGPRGGHARAPCSARASGWAVTTSRRRRWCCRCPRVRVTTGAPRLLVHGAPLLGSVSGTAADVLSVRQRPRDASPRASGLCGLMLGLGALLRPSNPHPGKLATYECGEPPSGPRLDQLQHPLLPDRARVRDLRRRAGVHLSGGGRVPRLGAPGVSGLFALAELVVFIGILVVGLVYVWVKGDLEWLKRVPRARHAADGACAKRPDVGGRRACR